MRVSRKRGNKTCRRIRPGEDLQLSSSPSFYSASARLSEAQPLSTALAEPVGAAAVGFAQRQKLVQNVVMETIGAFDANTHFASLLDRVAQG